ncbi:MAG: hemerythrin domain-containing protein, partial [Deltaproteobacteria bacterium]
MAPFIPLSDAELPLEFRDGIPDDLRVLLDDYPRDGWQRHPDFNGLTAFWIERHMTFRKLMKLMRSDTASLIDRTMDPATYKQRLAQLGTTFVGQLKGHHQIEDDQYFPMLEAMEMRLQRG